MKLSTHLLKTSALLVTIGFLALTACGSQSGFVESASNTVTDGSNSGQGTAPGTGGSTTNPNSPSWDPATQFKGVADDSGEILISVDKVNQALTIKLPFPGLVLPVLSNVTAPELEGVKLTTVTDASGTKYLALTVPLKYIIKGATFLPKETLPNGAPVEPFPSGEVPHVALQFPQKPDYRINLYIGTKAIAVFVETPKFSMPLGFMVDIHSQSGNKYVGFFGYLPASGAASGGVYLAARLPDDVALAISQVMGW